MVDYEVRKHAYVIVYDDLKNCRLFFGKHNPQCENMQYVMQGISVVMDKIARMAGYEDEFQLLWNANMFESELNNEKTD